MNNLVAISSFRSKCWIALALLSSPLPALAGGGGNSVGVPGIRVDIMDAEVRLEVKHTSLAQALDGLASISGVPIHYSAVPPGLVTATCRGATVKPVIECLLDHKANMVVRYAGRSSKGQPQVQPAEVWLLGTTFEYDQSSSVHNPAMAKTDSAPDASNQLLTMAKSENPSRRAEAIGRLMAGGRKGDVAVKKALEAALSDEDPKVRGQAITSLAMREGAGAAAALQQALQDSDVGVRLTAVARAGDNTALLQQATADSNASVREMATMRLNSLAQNAVTYEAIP